MNSLGRNSAGKLGGLEQIKRKKSRGPELTTEERTDGIILNPRKNRTSSQQEPEGRVQSYTIAGKIPKLKPKYQGVDRRMLHQQGEGALKTARRGSP